MNLSLGLQEVLSLSLFAALFFTIIFLLLKLIKNETARNYIKKVYHVFMVLATILIGILVFNLIRKAYFPTKPQVEFVPIK
jgi:hypothetical protein